MPSGSQARRQGQFLYALHRRCRARPGPPFLSQARGPADHDHPRRESGQPFGDAYRREYWQAIGAKARADRCDSSQFHCKCWSGKADRVTEKPPQSSTDLLRLILSMNPSWDESRRCRPRFAGLERRRDAGRSAMLRKSRPRAWDIPSRSRFCRYIPYTALEPSRNSDRIANR